MIIFVACSKSKLHYPCEAKKIYTASAIFNKRMTYAKRRTDKIYILSAKYGLLQLNDWVEPYECYLGSQGKAYKLEWTQNVLRQMRELNIDFNDEVYFATGEEYWKQLIKYFPNAKTEKQLVIEHLGRGGIGMSMLFYDLSNAQRN